uniref:Uncharacterized protein n=1 Tax=Arundo donax TaxID=35708 RepID=A0A0A9CE72_ARUDO
MHYYLCSHLQNQKRPDIVLGQKKNIKNELSQKFC